MFIQVAVPGPFLTPLDYQYVYDEKQVLPVVGGRVWVPFRSRKLIGIVMAIQETTELDAKKVRAITEVVDATPIFSEKDMQFLQWAAHYYHEPIGNVMQTALPKRLKEGEPIALEGVTAWQLTDAGRAEADEKIRPNAIQQLNLLEFLKTHPYPVAEATMTACLSGWRTPMKRFYEQGWVEKTEKNCLHAWQQAEEPNHALNDEQQAAVDEVLQTEGFKPFLLEGVTGSGKTETYLGMIEHVIAQGKQVLVLVPEIGLTPQTVERFERFLNQPVAVMHSNLTDKERHCAWYMVQSNQVKVLLGTRSALFTPFADLGLCILDEEHDLSFKQQDNFRYSARDALVRRAQLEKVPVVLGSATPSLETLHNALARRYGYLQLTQRAGGASMPEMTLLDVRGDQSVQQQEGVSSALREKMVTHLAQGGQVLLFLNRRGFAPVLMCHSCGWQAACPSCDANMTYHHQFRELRCHHCGYQQKSPQNCPSCGSHEFVNIGQGTEKLETVIQHWFPDHKTLRIDRDTTRNKGQMAEATQLAREGKADILIGTQMLAKGHHFPKVTLVALLDIDQGLFSCDFRAAERMAQLVVQVAGRAGRAERKGEVVIQTHHPEHPLLKTLVENGYDAFATETLAGRQVAELPPYTHQIMLRAESIDPHSAWQFLLDIESALQLKAEDQAKSARQGVAPLEVFGPVSAPMLRRQGRFRYQLLLQCSHRGLLHHWLGSLESNIYAHPLVNKVRWSIDVDPQEMS